MFKKQERLSQAEFQECFAKGKRHHSEHLTIITSPLLTRKFAVVVGKKVAKSAVVRNRLRRRVFAQLRIEIEASGFSQVLILIVKPSFKSLTRKESMTVITTEVARVCKSA